MGLKREGAGWTCCWTWFPMLLVVVSSVVGDVTVSDQGEVIPACDRSWLKIHCPMPDGSDACVVMTDESASEVMTFKPKTSYDKCCPVFNCSSDANPNRYHLHYIVRGGDVPKSPAVIQEERGNATKDDNCPSLMCRKGPVDHHDTFGLQCKKTTTDDSSRVKALSAFKDCCDVIKCTYADSSYFIHYEVLGESFFLMETAFYSSGDLVDYPSTTPHSIQGASSSTPSPMQSSTSEATSSTPSSTSTTQENMLSSTTQMSSSSTTAPSIGDYLVAITSTVYPSTNAPTTRTTTTTVAPPKPIAIVKSSNSSKTTVMKNPNGKGGSTSFKSSSSYVKMRPGGSVSGKNKGSNIQKATSYSESNWSGSQTAVDGGEATANFAGMQMTPQQGQFGQPYGYPPPGMGMGAPPGQFPPQGQGVGKSTNGKNAKGSKTSSITAGGVPSQFLPQQGKSTSNWRKTNGQKPATQSQMGMNPQMGMYMPQNQMYPGMGQPMMQQTMYMPNMYGAGAPMMYNG